MPERKQQVAEIVKKVVAEFLAKTNNQTSLITVSSVNTSPDLKKATVFITVLPENKEKAALDFAKRKRSEMRDLLKKSMRTKVIPFIEVEIDVGEKNRQRIDELLREK